MPAAAASPTVSTPYGDDLFVQAQAGSETAFATLLREHQAMVFGLAYQFLQNWAQAEELAQDVFLALHRNLGRIESAAHLVFWLRRVTRTGASTGCEALGTGSNSRWTLTASRPPQPACGTRCWTRCFGGSLPNCRPSRVSS